MTISGVDPPWHLLGSALQRLHWMDVVLLLFFCVFFFDDFKGEAAILGILEYS